MFSLAIADRISEIPYRLRRPHSAQSLTWSISPEELPNVAIVWPTRYEWPGCAVIVETIKDAFRRLNVLREEATPQTHKGVVMLYCVIDGKTRPLPLDYFDHHDFINESALAQSSLYLKCQYRSGGYGDRRIVAGGYPVTTRSYYHYYMPLRQRENQRPRIDIVGRFGFTFQGEIRRRAIAILTDDPSIDFVGSSGKVRYSRFLREVASARLSLHLPGNGPFTHRVAEFLGLGTCMVSLRFATELHVPLVPGKHYVEIADDLSDLQEKVHFYLAHEDERNRIAAEGREYFDKYLHADQMVAYYMFTIAERFAAESPDARPRTDSARIPALAAVH
jgi:hypothetical protein